MAEVLSAPSSHDGGHHFASSPLLRSPSQSSFFLDTASPSLSPPASDNILSRQHSTLRPSHSQPSLLHRSSSFSIQPSEHSLLPQKDSSQEDEIDFPSYDGLEAPLTLDNEPSTYDRHSEYEPLSNAPTPEVDTPADDPDGALNPVVDDIDARQEPSRQVDYLSHEWKEEDIWSSWRHIVARRKQYGERSRLENASWRTWAKQKYGLHTVSPETLNWLKDCDVTWLYGPLQEAPRNRRNSEPASHISKPPSFLKKKPILKKRSVSEEMLQKSLSSSSLVKQAAAAVQAQRNDGTKIQSRPTQRLRRCASDFDGTNTTYTGSTGTAEISDTLPSSISSGVTSREGNGKRRIRFDSNVEQCIAVDFKEGGREDEVNPEWTRACSDEESDDDLPMMKTKSKKISFSSTTTSSRNSFSSESRGIAKLPSTTIKFHHEEPSCGGHAPSQFKPLRSPALSPSPSQETLKPANESSRFLLGDQGDEDDDDSTPSASYFDIRRGSLSGQKLEQVPPKHYEEDTNNDKTGLRRTPSGMFMPFEEGEDDSMASNGIFGRITDTVNTARDICYVLYNVGWRR